MLYKLSEKIAYCYEQKKLIVLDTGEVKDITQKQTELLELLISKHPNSISSEEISLALWGGATSYENITQLITKLKSALDDRDKSILKNIARVGYCLPNLKAIESIDKYVDAPSAFQENDSAFLKIIRRIFISKAHAHYFYLSIAMFGLSIYTYYSSLKLPLSIDVRDKVKIEGRNIIIDLPDGQECRVDELKQEAICNE